MAVDLTSPDYIDLRPTGGTDLPVFQNAAQGTCSGWFIADATGGDRILVAFSIGNATPTNVSRFQLNLAGANFEIGTRRLDADALASIAAGVTISTGTVYFAIGRVNWVTGAGSIRVYAPDGTVSEGSGTFGWTAGGNTSNTPSRNAAIGAEDDGSGSVLDGKIWDVRAYDRYLSDAECDTMFVAKGADGIRTDLQHRFIINDGAAGTAIGGTANLIKDTGARRLTQQVASDSPLWYADPTSMMRRSSA